MLSFFDFLKTHGRRPRSSLMLHCNRRLPMCKSQSATKYIRVAPFQSKQREGAKEFFFPTRTFLLNARAAWAARARPSSARPGVSYTRVRTRCVSFERAAFVKCWLLPAQPFSDSARRPPKSQRTEKKAKRSAGQPGARRRRPALPAWKRRTCRGPLFFFSHFLNAGPLAP